MSHYSKRWTIDGLPTGLIMRSVPGNGKYTVVFEREFVSLEQIEAVNWAKPTIEYIGPHASEPGLPEGYGFVVDDHPVSERPQNLPRGPADRQPVSGRCHWIPGSDRRAGKLRPAEKDSALAEQATQLQEQADVLTAQQAVIEDQATQIQEQASTIEGQAATIQELQEAGTAAALEADLDAAYEEGVNSVE